MPERLFDVVFVVVVLVGACVAATNLDLGPREPTELPALTFPTEGFQCVKPLPNPPRLRALVIGDSNIFGPLGKYLERSLGALGYDVKRLGKPISGLARPDFYNWTTEARVLLDAHTPSLVITMFGGNDGQPLGATDRSLGAVRLSDGDAWSQEYAGRVRAFAELLRGHGRRVFFLSPTNRRPVSAREKMQRVRTAQREALDGLSNVTWIDMFPPSSDEHGQWLQSGVDVAGDPVNYRRPDGIHLTPKGARVVGRRVLERLLDEGLTLCGARD